MCGIVGHLNNSRYGMCHRDIKTFYNLLTVDAVRGADGTGMFWQDGDGKLWLSKSPLHVGAAFTRTLVDRHLAGDTRFVVGHNRAATLGELTEENTHPFTYPNVTGVHNGTVHGWKSLGSKKATMDSMAIFEVLSDTGESLSEVSEFLAKIDGAYALVWFDQRTKELRFARNHERPLYLATTHSDGIWFASELRMLEWVLDRNNVRMQTAFQLEENMLLSIPAAGGTPEYHPYVPDWESTGYTIGSWGNYGKQYAQSYQQHTFKEFKKDDAEDAVYNPVYDTFDDYDDTLDIWDASWGIRRGGLQ